ncbi:MAG: hypothetical protein D6711_18620 [Chloroflexi bacterium]|nr:MAG: hypothetical protein D6711_18620 [Chloroflexota bacterium]
MIDISTGEFTTRFVSDEDDVLITDITWSDNRIAFVYNYQLYVMDVSSGEISVPLPDSYVLAIQ